MNRGIFSVLAGLMLLAPACGGESDRQEVISKLRTLGVSASPVVSAWSPEGGTPLETVLTIYAALPLGQQMTVEPYRDPLQTAPLTFAATDIAVDLASVKTTVVGSLQLVEAKARVKVPTLAQALAARALPPGASGAQLNYGFRLTSGAEEELVVGTFLAYADGSPELNFSAPTVEIVEPADGSMLPKDAKGSLRASVANANSEEIKLGWFATGGEIQNRRAKLTDWKHPGAGTQTIILTVRGKKSRGFSLKAIAVTTE